MVQSEKLRFRKGDWLAISTVVLLAAAVLFCFFPGSKAPDASVEIYLYGDLVKTVDLRKDQTFVIQ